MTEPDAAPLTAEDTAEPTALSRDADAAWEALRLELALPEPGATYRDAFARHRPLIEAAVRASGSPTDAARPFVLRRTNDVSGVSGLGDVAEGVVFTDGTTVLRWLRAGGSTAVYDSLEHMEAIHGHDGGTAVVWAASGSPEPALDVERLAMAFARVQPGVYGWYWPRDDPDEFQFLNPRDHAEAIAREYAALAPSEPTDD